MTARASRRRCAPCGGRVDGLIVMSPDIDVPALTANLPESLPVVLLNCAVDGDAYDAISVDNYGGAYAMVRHLLSRGRDRVAIITGSTRNYDARERLRGYRAAMHDAGALSREEWEIAGDFTEAGGHRAGMALAALAPRPTAVFAANDAMAIGALSALREVGMRVPEDIAVAGFDDIPMARYMSPPLTSVPRRNQCTRGSCHGDLAPPRSARRITTNGGRRCCRRHS